MIPWMPAPTPLTMQVSMFCLLMAVGLVRGLSPSRLAIQVVFYVATVAFLRWWLAI